jgi:hypothetical protein
MTSPETLPDDLLCIVLRYLDARSVGRAARTSRRLHRGVAATAGVVFAAVVVDEEDSWTETRLAAFVHRYGALVRSLHVRARRISGEKEACLHLRGTETRAFTANPYAGIQRPFTLSVAAYWRPCRCSPTFPSSTDATSSPTTTKTSCATCLSERTVRSGADMALRCKDLTRTISTCVRFARLS